MRGVTVQQPYPLKAAHAAQLSQQRGKAAVACGVLRDQVYFLNAGACQGAGFLDNGAARALAKRALDGRNRAVGAAVRTAFGDFDVGG